jgi:hypothetical protein
MPWVLMVVRGDVAGEQVVDLAKGEIALLFSCIDELLDVFFVLVDFFSHGDAHSCLDFLGIRQRHRRTIPLVVS